MKKETKRAISKWYRMMSKAIYEQSNMGFDSYSHAMDTNHQYMVALGLLVHDGGIADNRKARIFRHIG